MEAEDEELDIKNKETNKENEKLEADNELLETKIVASITLSSISIIHWSTFSCQNVLDSEDYLS